MTNKGNIKLKMLIIASGLTNTEIAKKVNCHPSMISHLIRGNKKSKRIQKEIAKLFNTTEENLFGDAA